MFGAIAGGIASALAGGAMSKLFGGGQKAASGGIQGDVLATDNNTVGMGDAGIKSARSEERRVGKECRSRWAAGHKKKKTSGMPMCRAVHARGNLASDVTAFLLRPANSA